MTGWHWSHARKALAEALNPKVCLRAVARSQVAGQDGGDPLPAHDVLLATGRGVLVSWQRAGVDLWMPTPLSAGWHG